jgi:biopolymer transport protein ExbD
MSDVRHRYLERQEPRMNIIPMIDIMMFLLVFFVLIVLHMIPDTGVPMHLPGASTAQHLPHKSLVIGISKGGLIKFEDKTMSAAELKTALEQVKKTHRLSVILAGNKHASLQDLMQVMNTVREAGISNVGIATKR